MLPYKYLKRVDGTQSEIVTRVDTGTQTQREGFTHVIYDCEKCGRSYGLFSSLQRHLKIKHQAQEYEEPARSRYDGFYCCLCNCLVFESFNHHQKRKNHQRTLKKDKFYLPILKNE